MVWHRRAGRWLTGYARGAASGQEWEAVVGGASGSGEEGWGRGGA
jgi:hypothetical protein